MTTTSFAVGAMASSVAHLMIGTLQMPSSIPAAEMGLEAAPEAYRHKQLSQLALLQTRSHLGTFPSLLSDRNGHDAEGPRGRSEPVGLLGRMWQPHQMALPCQLTVSGSQVGPLFATFCGGIAVGVAITLLLLALLRGDPKANDPPSAQDAEARYHSATEELETMHLFRPRCGCLMMLLLVHSLPSFIIDGYSHLFEAHPSLTSFLTMILGTGGNVGGQSVVLAVRRLAIGEFVSVSNEVFVGFQLSLILTGLSFLRCITQGISWMGSATISSACAVVVVLGAALGAATPKVLCWARIDPAHATPLIQAMMDLLGVFITCMIGRVLLIGVL